jgi:anaphase-promoting complex subunit 1
MMKDFDEKTIWTSDTVPLMASYHKGFCFTFLYLCIFPFRGL